MTNLSSDHPRTVLHIELDDLTQGQRHELTDAIAKILQDLRRGGPSEQMVRGWTRLSLREALTRLEREGGWVQARCIEWALSHGGTVPRDEVYRIGNYSAKRMLRGWTRPANRIVSTMRAAGAIPATAADLLEPIYDNDVKAGGFRVPVELAVLLDDK